MEIVNLIDHIRQQTGTNAKLAVLKQNEDDQMLRRVLALAYDCNRYKFGLSHSVLANLIKDRTPCGVFEMLDNSNHSNWEQVVSFMESKLGRGSNASNVKMEFVKLVQRLSSAEIELVKDILRRNLKIGLASNCINKTLPGTLSAGVPYMRCGIFDESSAKNIHFPAMLQVKMDGTYRQIDVGNHDVRIRTRQGKDDYNPVLYSIFNKLPNGTYIGELTIPGVSRVESNGNINSDSPDYERIVFTAWDYLEPDTDKPYSERFKDLTTILPVTENTNVVTTKMVNSIAEIKTIVNGWMSEGLEGGVLKDLNNKFKNGTSKTQLKIKKIVDADVRIIGFKNGSARSAREGKVGALRYGTDDGIVTGYVSGFNDDFLDMVTAQPDKFIGKVMTVRFNDIHQDSNGGYSLQLPRFIEIRDDKDNTDTIIRIKEMLEMPQLL